MTDGNKKRVEVSGVGVDVLELGSGQSLLFLHSGEGPDKPSDRYLHELAKHYRVIAPWHPGFGHSEMPHEFRSVDDLAYFYLDFADAYELQDAVLAGGSFGGWIAAEMAIRNTARFSKLVLADPFGVKAGDRETRDYVDIFAIPSSEWVELCFHDPEIMRRDFTKLDEDALMAIVRSREALAYYGWEPYMHNPQLRRWLHRIDIPTLVLWGRHDKVVDIACGELYASTIPDARMEMIEAAGHYPHVEQPEAFVRRVVEFAPAAEEAGLARRTAS